MCLGGGGGGNNNAQLQQQQAQNDQLISQIRAESAANLQQAQAASSAAIEAANANAKSIADAMSQALERAGQQSADIGKQITDMQGQVVASQNSALAFMRQEALNHGQAAKAPNIGVIGRKVADLYRSSSSKLTGPKGVAASALSLGRNSLLGEQTSAPATGPKPAKLSGGNMGLLGMTG